MKNDKIYFYLCGTGASFGSPAAYNRNGNIDTNNLKNFRTRSSVFLRVNNTNVLIDCSPDLRQQMMNAKINDLDLILFTHEHSDHTAGVPDIRPFSLFNSKIIPAYMPEKMIENMSNNYKFVFYGEKSYQPFMKIHKLENEFEFNGIKIETFKHNHGDIDCQTYIINKRFAYTTDFKKFYKQEDIDRLKNIEVFIIGLLKYEKHPSHASFEEIMEIVKYIKPKKLCLLTHMTALIDYEDILKRLPERVLPGYDGFTYEF